MGKTEIRGAQIKDETIREQDIGPGAVRGATANDGTQQEIAIGTVSDIDLRDSSVIPAKVDSTKDFQMGTLSLNDGSSASPALTFKNDPNTGIFRVNPDVLDITAGGVNVASFFTNRLIMRVNGTAPSPSYSWSDANEGIFHTGFDSFGMSAQGVEQARIQNGALALQNGAKLYLTNGAVGTPSLTFGTDLNLGLYRIGTDILGFATNGTEALRIDASQNVGLGGSSVTDAILSLTSTTKAFLPPRLTTTQRDALGTPVDGMLIFNSTTGVLNIYATTWGEIAAVETDPLSIHLDGGNSPSAAIDWNQQELQQMVVHKLASDPVSPVEGQLWYNTTDGQWKGYDGTSIKILG